MNYKNEKHRELFGEVVKRKDKKDYELMSALYILTSDLRLWQKVKRYTEKSITSYIPSPKWTSIYKISTDSRWE